MLNAPVVGPEVEPTASSEPSVRTAAPLPRLESGGEDPSAGGIPAVSRRSIRPILLPILAVFPAIAAYELILRFFAQDALLMVLLCMVTVCAALDGLVAGVLATLLGTLAGVYFFEPRAALSLNRPGEYVLLGLFLFIGFLVSGLSERALRAARRSRADAAVARKSAAEREQAAEALRESAERLRLALSAARMGDWSWDPESDLVNLSPRAAEVFGLPPGPVMTWTKLLERFHDEDRERAREDSVPVRSARSDIDAEYRIVHPDGSIRWVLARGRATLRPDGTIHGLLGVVQDITERRRAEEVLRESEARFRQLAEAMPQFVWTARPDGYLDYFNSRWYDYTGMPRTGDQGWNWHQYLHPEEQAVVPAIWRRTLQQGSPYDVRVRFRRASDGCWRWFIGRALPVRDSEGNIVRWLGTCTDIDDQVRAEEALREADRRKDEYLAMLAHELRNPLAPILTAVHILRLASPDGMVRKQRDVIERQVQHMKRLLDDLLDVSRITRGMVSLQKEPIELAPVLSQAIEASRPSIDARRHALTINLPPMAIRLEADPTRLAQVVTNLLNNAARYTDEGGHIELNVHRIGDRVAIHVRDNGIGMTPAVMARAFDLFAQGDRALDRSQGGLGVGLTMVQKLVELHGGSVRVHSDGPGCGSEFIVELPMLVEPDHREIATGAHPESLSQVSRARKVLLVDDNVDSAETLGVLLELDGYRVRIVHDGPAAISTATAFQPDVVVLDIGLPGMDGYEVARRLREEPFTRNALLIALTGYGQQEDRRRAREAGFDQHLVKPVRPEVLEALIASPETVRDIC